MQAWVGHFCPTPLAWILTLNQSVSCEPGLTGLPEEKINFKKTIFKINFKISSTGPTSKSTAKNQLQANQQHKFNFKNNANFKGVGQERPTHTPPIHNSYRVFMNVTRSAFCSADSSMLKRCS